MPPLTFCRFALMNNVNNCENGFEAVFRNSKDGLAIFKDEVFIDCNASMLTLVGVDNRDDFIGKTPFDFSPARQHDGTLSVTKGLALVARCHQEGSVRFEWIIKRFNGDALWVEIILTKMTMDGEEVIYASWRDISESKAIELALKEQKNTFETLFNESQDGLSLLIDNQFIDCNKALLDMFGYSSKEEILGLTPMDLSPEYQADGRRSVDVVADNAKQVAGYGNKMLEWQHQRADGSLFWTEIIVIEIKLNGGPAIYAITRDISEKKALQEKIISRNEALKATNRSLSETIESLKLAQSKLVESEKMASLGSLVAGVAHEINTPVGIGLTGITQLMEECRDIQTRYEQGNLTENDFEDYLNSASELAGMIKKNIDRTAQLVRSFKQVAVDQTSEEDREVNLNQYLDEIFYSLSSVLRKAKVVVATECRNDINVETNPGLLPQVAPNLIMNSVNHGFKDRDAGNIYIGISEQEDNMFIMQYRDDGRGINKENLSRIFDPFFTTNRSHGGTGLGLNITYNIITNALGGSITCNSEENKGVEFIIKFKVKARLD